MILDGISKPSDLKNLSIQQLNDLCSELRSEIVRITSKNGGHLGSNLGSVELIVAAHYVFNIETDKFIFDVGHQAYVHKLLTGRRGLMENLRTDKGASGFIDPSESEYDHFISGHASTSLSAALGIAKARDLNGENFKVLSLLGDGSLTGGMVYEALNNASGTKNFIVILNDNQMSISESVGSMKKYLSKLLTSRGGLSIRKFTSEILSWVPKTISRKIESLIKNIIQGSNIFEEFGFQYVGPIDGHDIDTLIKVFTNIRDVATYKPVLIHSITQKGKGYHEAECDATKLHGIEKPYKLRYTNVFGESITKLAEEDSKIVCITAAMKNGTGLLEFSKKFPERFFDVGIAESHAVTFSAGLAKQGFKPFVCIYSTFLQRAFDQIYHDVVLQNLPVRFIIDKAGFPGADGKTHAGLYDVAMLQNFGNFKILSPSNRFEFEEMLHIMAMTNDSPSAIRFPKAEAINPTEIYEFSNQSRIVLKGREYLIVSVGNMLETVLEAVKISKKSPTVIDARFIQPFDFETFYSLEKNHMRILFVEEGVFGGLSNIILERLLRDGKKEIIEKIRFITVSKNNVKHASRTEQMEDSQMSALELSKLI